jgi:hypothetical protein
MKTKNLVHSRRCANRSSDEWLGRVIAREIGHYVLRSRQHAADGLIWPMQLAWSPSHAGISC